MGQMTGFYRLEDFGAEIAPRALPWGSATPKSEQLCLPRLEAGRDICNTEPILIASGFHDAKDDFPER